MNKLCGRIQKYVSKEEALQMMKDYAPQIGEKQRGKYWRFTSIPGIPTLIWANFEKIMKVAGSEKSGYRSVLYGMDGGITPYRLPWVVTRVIAFKDYLMMMLGRIGGVGLLEKAFSTDDYSKEDLEYVSEVLKHCSRKTLWRTFDLSLLVGALYNIVDQIFIPVYKAIYSIQQHIMELGESDKLLQAEKEAAAAEAEALRKKCQASESAIEKAKAQRMTEFEAYALGRKKSYDASIDEVEAFRKKHEAQMVQLSEAEDKVRKLNRMKVHESFAVTKLTDELLDEYVESIAVHPGNEVRISWR